MTTTPARPYVLGVDLDNVTAQYTEGLRNFMVSKGFTPDTMPEPHDYCFVESGWPFKDRSDFLDKHIEMVTSGGFLSLSPMEGASEVLNKLVEEGVKIRIITHRLLRDGTYAMAISDTVRWLDAHNIPFHDFCAISEKSAVGVDLLIDDAPSNINAVRAVGHDVLVFDKLYNQGLDDPRAKNWDEVYTFVTEHRKTLGK